MKKIVIFLLAFSCCFLYAADPREHAKSLSTAFTTIAKDATPAVVFIKVENQPVDRFGRPYNSNPQNEMFSDEFFQRFFGGTPHGRGQQPPQPQLSQGSGFFVSEDGYVMTNYHVIRNAKNITVYLNNGSDRELKAKLVGGDPQTDVAILKVDNPENRKFSYLDFGNSDQVEVGEWAIAIGNPFQLEATVTVGVVSAKGRQGLQISDLEDFLQTDAAINPGNSGGPLLDLDGKVIGINTAIVAPAGGYVGIGFAVPSRIAINIKEQVISDGKITRGFLGVTTQDVDKDLAESFGLSSPEGVLVTDVVKESPADKAGIQQGDIILKVNKTHIRSIKQLQNDIMLLKPGKKIKVTLNRNGKIIQVPVTIGNHSDLFPNNSVKSDKIGFSVDNITPDNIAQYHLDKEETGVVIVDVVQNSLAFRAGLKPGFVIMAVNHKKITNVKDYNEAMKSPDGQNRLLLLVKQGKLMRFYAIKLN